MPRASRAVGAVTAALVTATLAGCGGSDSGAADERLDVWVAQDASTVVQERFVEEFNEQSDIDINLVRVSGEAIHDRVRRAMSSDNPPDVFYNWGGSSIAEFVDQGLLYDLSDTLESDRQFLNSFIPNILENAVVDGHYYGIPMRGVQPVILFYNETLFEEVGVEPPETYDDLLNLVDVFLAEGITPFALGGGEAWPDLMWLEILVDRYGGSDVFRRIQNGDMDGWRDPAMRWAAEEVASLVERGAFGSDYQELKYTDDSAPTYFAEGNAAMHLMGSWEYANQLAHQKKFAQNNLAYIPFPEIEGGEGDPRDVVGNPNNYWSLHASLGEEGQEDRLAAAVEFLKMMATEEYSQALIDNGDVPATTTAKYMLDSHPNPEYAKFQYDLVANATNFQLSWNQALPREESDTMDAAILELFNGDLAPDEFIERMTHLGESDG